MPLDLSTPLSGYIENHVTKLVPKGHFDVQRLHGKLLNGRENTCFVILRYFVQVMLRLPSLLRYGNLRTRLYYNARTVSLAVHYTDLNLPINL